jgi:hypothetical protein
MNRPSNRRHPVLANNASDSDPAESQLMVKAIRMVVGKRLWQDKNVLLVACVRNYEALVRSWDWLKTLQHPNILRYIGTTVVRNSQSGILYP